MRVLLLKRSTIDRGSTFPLLKGFLNGGAPQPKIVEINECRPRFEKRTQWYTWAMELFVGMPFFFFLLKSVSG